MCHINWAKVIESIAKEKTPKDKVKGGQLGTMKETTDSGGNIMRNGNSIMPSENVVLLHVKLVQMDLEYGGALVFYLQTRQHQLILYIPSVPLK